MKTRPDGSPRDFSVGLAVLALAQLPLWVGTSWLLQTRISLLMLVAALADAVLGFACIHGVVARSSDRSLGAARSSEAAGQRLRDEMVEREQRLAAARAQTHGLSAAFDTLCDDLRERLDRVVAAIASLRGTADDFSRAVLRITSETTSVLVAAEEADRQTATVVEAGQEFLEVITRIGTHACHSAEMGLKVVSLTESTATSIDELAAISDKIGTMTALIAGIANQTNLLALNATIEAARAGQQGMGFAVVAGEVKSLARDTAKAVAMIAEMVTAIREATSRAGEAIRATNASIGGLNQATADIAAAVDERVTAAARIASSVSTTASNVAFVASALGKIETAVDVAVDCTGFLRATAGEISDQTSDIRCRIERCAAAFHPRPASGPGSASAPVLGLETAA